MANRDFNLQMDGYLDERRSQKQQPFVSSKTNQDVEEQVPDNLTDASVYVIKKPKTFWQKFLDSFSRTKEEDFEEQPKEEVQATITEEQDFEQEYDEIKQEEQETGFWGRIFSFFSRNVDEEYEDMDTEAKLEVDSTQEQKEPEEQKEEVQETLHTEEKSSFWSRFFGFFGMSVQDHDDDESEEQSEEEEQPTPSTEKMIELKQDLKDVAVITTAVIKNLPKEQFKLFKESSDFVQFKSILKKHNIIKEKE